MNTQNIFFDSDERAVIHATEVKAFAYAENFQNNSFLADFFMDSFDSYEIREALFDIFTNPTKIDEIKSKLANTLADRFLEECANDENERFVPIDSVSDLAICELDSIEDEEDEDEVED